MTDAGGNEKVAILDAGAQYGKVIDRRVRELSIETIMLPLDTSPDVLRSKNVRAVIVSGGPGSVYEKDSPNWHPELMHSGLPIFGICYGMQLMNRDSKGSVTSGMSREDGQFKVQLELSSPLYSGLNKEEDFLLTHADVCSQVGDGVQINAKVGETIVGIENREKKLYGVQFHPEVDLSPKGIDLFKNFLLNIAGCQQNFDLGSRETECIAEIQAKCGATNKVLCLVSGGVDSSVCCALLHKAIGVERVVAVHIDNGFLRKNESETVKESLENIDLKLHVVNESHRFYHATTRTPVRHGQNTVNVEIGPLNIVTAPEEKRKIIGDTFIKVFEDVLSILKLDVETTLLAQGTLRPDLIESASHLASSNADTIKTHHNDTELVRQLREKGRVIEPLKDFHKDEVRQIGRDLGLPEQLVERHPFPGPGLAVRLLCAEEKFCCKDFSDISNTLNFIVNFAQALSKPHPLMNKIQQTLSTTDSEILRSITSKQKYTSTLLPIKTVGVQGDCRTYSYVAALSSDDEPCWESLMQFAKIIPKLCPVNRVTYVFGGSVKHPVQEITRTTLTVNVLKTLRQVDFLANKVLLETGAVKQITQMPVVLIPVHFDIDPVSRDPVCQRSVVLRPFSTNDFMTGVAAQPGKDVPLEVVHKMVNSIKTVPGISRVLYDLTSKPPGTTEWE